MKIWHKVADLFDRINVFLSAMAGCLVVFLMLSTGIDVVMRYIINEPIDWRIEMSRYALVWITFLGAAWVLKREAHVKMDLVIARLKPRTQSLINSLTYGISAIVCLGLACYGAAATWRYFSVGYVSSSTLEFPLGPVLAIFPLGFFLLSVQLARRTSDYLNQWRSLPKRRE